MDKPIDIFRDLVDSSILHNNEMKIKLIHYKGEELPEHLLPGRTIMNLSPEKRCILCKLTSEEVSKERLF